MIVVLIHLPNEPSFHARNCLFAPSKVAADYIDARARAPKVAPLQACSAYLVTRMLPKPRASRRDSPVPF
jgi:hypothetical protein